MHNRIGKPERHTAMVLIAEDQAGVRIRSNYPEGVVEPLQKGNSPYPLPQSIPPAEGVDELPGHLHIQIAIIQRREIALGLPLHIGVGRCRERRRLLPRE